MYRWLVCLMVVGCGESTTGPIWAARYNFDQDCLSEDEEIGRFPGRSARVTEDSSVWIRNNATSELWFLLTTTDLDHLDEEWEIAECNESPCVEDIGPGGRAYAACEVEAAASSGAADAD